MGFKLFWCCTDWTQNHVKRLYNHAKSGYSTRAGPGAGGWALGASGWGLGAGGLGLGAGGPRAVGFGLGVEGWKPMIIDKTSTGINGTK